MKKFLLMITIFLCITPTVFGATPIYNSFEFETWSSITFNNYANAVMGTSGLDYYSKGISDERFVNSMSNNYFKVMRNKDGNLFYATTTSINSYLNIDYSSTYGFYTPWMNSFNFNSSNLNMTYERIIRDMQLTFSNSGLENFDDYNSLIYLKTAIPEFYPVISGPVFSATFNSYINETPIKSEEIIPDTTNSIYGYLWSPSVISGDVEINLDYKENNQLIHGEHFIGSALQSSFVFYYYSGDNVVSFNDYVTRNAYLSTDYGTWYDFYIEPENLEYLPNNTDFYLNIYATLNDNTATVVKDFLAFHTVDNSGGGTGGDTNGDNGDYTGQLNQIEGSLNNIENKIPTSGDIEQATQNGVVQGSTDYWGSSGDLTGEKQEELISGKVDELTEQISGDLAENEIFSILKTYEDKLFGGFTGEKDFKISWNDISYMNSVIIPKGEVNFSEICRENEALGRVKTTINIILGFMLLYNCVIYLYNLLLATLGIDNPYLYEKPQDVTTTTITSDITTGRKTMVTSTRKADGNTYNVRRSIK